MFFRRATPESPHSHLLRFQFLETRKTPPKWPRVSMTVFGTIPPVLPCYGAPPRILTARCPPLSLPCFGRVSKRPRESALFAVPAESGQLFPHPARETRPFPGSPPHHQGTSRALTFSTDQRVFATGHRPSRSLSHFQRPARVSNGTPVSPPRGRNHYPCRPSPHQRVQAYPNPP